MRVATEFSSYLRHAARHRGPMEVPGEELALEGMPVGQKMVPSALAHLAAGESLFMFLLVKLSGCRDGLGVAMNTKPAAQMSLEAIMERNRQEVERLKEEVDAKLAENARIETEMKRILSSQPPPSSKPPSSRLVEAYKAAASSQPVTIAQHKNGEAMARLAAENATTLPPLSESRAAERDVVFAAVAMVRSWKRRHKKRYQNQEKELVECVERLVWDR